MVAGLYDRGVHAQPLIILGDVHGWGERLFMEDDEPSVCRGELDAVLLGFVEKRKELGTAETPQ